MANVTPTMSTSTDASLPGEPLHQTDAELLASVSMQLQAQLREQSLLSQEARECLEKLSVFLAAPKHGDQSSLPFEDSQTSVFPNAGQTLKRKATTIHRRSKKHPCNTASTDREARVGAQKKLAPASRTLDRSPYVYRAQWERRFVDRFCRKLKAFHMSSEEEHLQEVTRILLPQPDDDEILLGASLTTLPAPTSEERSDMSPDHDGSSDGSNVSSLCSSPPLRPITPESEFSSCPSPKAFAAPFTSSTQSGLGDNTWTSSELLIEAGDFVPQPDVAVKSALTRDEAMSGTDEAPQSNTAPDVQMIDTTEDLHASNPSDEDMANVSEDTGDVDMISTRGDGIAPGSSRGLSQEAVMEDVPTADIAGNALRIPLPAFIAGSAQVDEEMEGVQSTISAPLIMPLPTYPPQQRAATLALGSWNARQPGTAADEAPVSSPAFDVNDFTEGIWHELSDLGPSLHTDLRAPDGRVNDSVLEAEPDLHETVLKHISGAATAVGLLRLLKIAHRRGMVSLQQLRSLRVCVAQAQMANTSTHNVSPPTHFQEQPVLRPLTPDPREQGSYPIDLTDPVWDELSNLGPRFHIDLKRISVSQSVLKAHPKWDIRVWDGILMAASSERLIKFLKFRHEGVQNTVLEDKSDSWKLLSLSQASVIRDCVFKFRSENEGLTDNDVDNHNEDNNRVQDASSVENSENLPVASPQSTQEDLVHLSTFFSGVPQQHYLPTRPPPQPLSSEDALHAERLLGLLHQASVSINEHRKLLKRFAPIFNLPWHDTSEMKRIVQCVIHIKTRGVKNATTAESFANDMCTRDAPDIIHICASSALATVLELQAVSKFISYKARRQDWAARIFQTIATSNYRILKAQNDDGCLSWQGMQELASREEGNFFQPGKSTTELGFKFYQAYIDARVAHWREPQHLCDYVEKLNGDTELTVGKWVFEPSTATKRGGDRSGPDEEADKNDASPMQPRLVKRLKATIPPDAEQ